MDRRTSVLARSGEFPTVDRGAVSLGPRSTGSQGAPVSRAERTSAPGSASFDEAPASLVASTRKGGVRAAFERRSSSRAPVDLDVSIGSDDHFFTATASDLSTGGLFVETYRALPVGCELSIEFEVPAGRFVGRGVVAWAREAQGNRAPGYGIRFGEQSRYARPLLEGFCRSLAGVPSSRLLAG